MNPFLANSMANQAKLNLFPPVPWDNTTSGRDLLRILASLIVGGKMKGSCVDLAERESQSKVGYQISTLTGRFLVLSMYA
jgi:hypothetical protein